MKKMKKLLALMCIAIAALIWLPGLKFPAEAGSIDYEEAVSGESGGDVTLSINLNKLNLPAGFEVGSCNWITDGETVSADGGTVSADGLSYTLRNVTKSQVVSVYISDKYKKNPPLYPRSCVHNFVLRKAINSSVITA